jgi:Holliday junction resolvase RusA-like endonuclease
MTDPVTYDRRVEIDGLPRVNSADNRHWRVKQRERDEWHRRVGGAFRGLLPPRPLLLARVELTRHSSREPDLDNLAASFKHVLDGLVRHRVLADDRPSIVPEFVPRWEKAAPKGGKISIRVISLEGRL